MGWSWTGRAPAYTHHNEVAFNHIHHLGNGVLNDIGGIYTLGVSPGTVLHHNLIHDVSRYEWGKVGYGGWGIYLDAGSSEIRVEDNVVYNTRDGGFHAHCDGYPYGDEIVNNVFACSDAGQMIRDNIKEPEGYHVRLERNIIYNPNNRMYQGNWKSGGKFSADSNCYWGDGGDALDFAGRSFAAWKAEGRDAHAIVADPRFVDATRRDFRLQPDSPALKLGFNPIDLSGVGLYGPEDWRRMPDGVTHRAYEQAPPPVEGPLEENFEEYDAGDHPAGAVEKEGGAEATVSDLDPASGHRCLRFVDAPDVTAWKPHWCLYRTAGSGKVRLQCGVKNDPSEPATFDLEFRDWPSGEGYSTGPHLRFFPDGTVQAAGKAGQAQWTPIGRYDLGKWLRVEIEFEEGTDKPKTYELRLTESGRPLVEREDLPFRSDAFKTCTWVGLSGMDTKRAVFYMDAFRIQ
jgi:hypothetical protein